MDCYSRVQKTIDDQRQKFTRRHDVSALEMRLASAITLLNECSNRRDLRRRNALARDVEQLQQEIQRVKKKQDMFEHIASDVHEAMNIAIRMPPRETAAVATTATAAAKPVESFVADTQLLLEDVMLLDDGERLQDARAQVDDICINCGTLMERNMQLSYLVCPNVDCQHMRWYMDTSTFNSSAYATRMEIAKNAPKCVTHYSTFLNTCQGKTTKKFPRDYLIKICFYCYVEGARSPLEITKELINKAQKYLGATEYNISTILKTQLRGNSLRLPPDVIKKLQLLFKALWPVFAQMKNELDPKRANMINFNFVSRVLCRLLGYDVFLPLFDKFRMPCNEIKHSAFMRHMFGKLGWIWEDRTLTDIPDSVLDEFEQREGDFLAGDDEGDMEVDE
jgi:hypothetical protein